MLIEALARVPDVAGSSSADIARSPIWSELRALAAALGVADRVDVHRPDRTGDSRRALCGGRHPGAAEPGVRDLEPRSPRRSSCSSTWPPGAPSSRRTCRRSARCSSTTSMRCSSRRGCRRAGGRYLARLRPIRRWRQRLARRRATTSRSTPGTGAPNGSRRSSKVLDAR